MTTLHLAQVNIARIRAPLEDPVMAEFVARLDEIDSLAERSYLRPFEDERIIVNSLFRRIAMSNPVRLL